VTYFAVGDDFHRHEKIERLASRGPSTFSAAVTIWALAGSWCGDHGTGGLVPERSRWELGTRRAPLVLDPLTTDQIRAAVEALVEVGLWERVEGGYQVHDWDDQNFSAEQEAEKKRQATERQRKRRARLRGDSVTCDEPPLSRVTSRVTESDGHANVTITHARAPLPLSLPLPDPIPEREQRAPAHHGPTSFDRGASIPASVDHDTTAALIAAPAPNGGPSDIQAEAWRLAQLHDQLGMAVAKTHGASWRSLQNSGPRLWLATLQGGETEDACRHVLTILAAEADERARLSVRDPLRFLRTPTTPDIWLRATGLPDEETARESVRARTASGRGPGSGQDPSPEPARRLKRLG
jgi:hypothetical protein